MKLIKICRFLLVALSLGVIQFSNAQEKKLTDAQIAAAQGHGDAIADNDPRKYIKDPNVLENLEKWQDLKFGFMVHWVPSSQWEIDASWSLCEEKDWGRSKNPKWAEAGQNIDKYRQMYWDLNKTFNPTEFNAKEWAKLAKSTGMKYFAFTTMHHDGFCMFDSKFTDYKITGKDCPYSSNKNADITKELYNSFRKEGLGITLYYSKPSWHNNDFWIKDQPKPTRNTNYDLAQDPARWERFVKFTQGQIDQLLSEYGKIDVLWLDGGWVNPNNKNQSIRMNEIAENGRKKQPGLIVVDRTIHGEFENFITPEQSIPKKAIPYPWETCMTMGRIWGYSPADTLNYKSPAAIISKLIDVVSKGGNFLFNVGAMSNGKFDPKAIMRLNEVGKWMKVNGEAIYTSRSIAPYNDGNIYYTRTKDSKTVFAFCVYDEKVSAMPEKIFIPSFQPVAGSKVKMLGSKENLKWEKSDKGIFVYIPEKLRKLAGSQFAKVLKIDIVGK